MNITERFDQYAQDFEDVFVSDDWTRLERYFSVDARYVTKGARASTSEGRDEVLRTLRKNVSGFDRCFDSRELTALCEPKVEGNRLQREWRCEFKLLGAPNLTIEGVETATYVGDQIVLLEEELTAEAQQSMKSWLKEHGSRLVKTGPAR